MRRTIHLKPLLPLICKDQWRILSMPRQLSSTLCSSKWATWNRPHSVHIVSAPNLKTVQSICSPQPQKRNNLKGHSPLRWTTWEHKKKKWQTNSSSFSGQFDLFVAIKWDKTASEAALLWERLFIIVVCLLKPIQVKQSALKYLWMYSLFSNSDHL